MRRFSQRNSLVTLNEINITPLLDLAFVLLIIFVITTPLLEQSLDLNLPSGIGTNRKIDRNDIATVEVSPQGAFVLNGRVLPRGLAQLETDLVALRLVRPNLVVNLRADEGGAYKHPYAILDLCTRLGIKIGLASQPPAGPPRSR
jgi:biopolymer transport protein ExbD